MTKWMVVEFFKKLGLGVEKFKLFFFFFSSYFFLFLIFLHLTVRAVCSGKFIVETGPWSALHLESVFGVLYSPFRSPTRKLTVLLMLPL
jgi:hypothetical protein